MKPWDWLICSHQLLATPLVHPHNARALSVEPDGCEILKSRAYPSQLHQLCSINSSSHHVCFMNIHNDNIVSWTEVYDSQVISKRNRNPSCKGNTTLSNKRTTGNFNFFDQCTCSVLPHSTLDHLGKFYEQKVAVDARKSTETTRYFIPHVLVSPLSFSEEP